MRCLIASLTLLLGLAPLASAQDSPIAPEQIQSDAMRALTLKRVNPIYPPLARQARIQGTVVLSIVITKSGEVQDVQLVSGHPMLAPAAIEAVRQWKYKPYERDGEALDVQTTVQVNFKLAPKPVPYGIAGDARGRLPLGAIGSIASEAPQTPPDAASLNRVRLSEAVMRRLRIQNIEPTYPVLALQARIQGTVVLRVQINQSGAVESVALISGHPMLATSAIEAVKQWKYSPYVLNGNPQTVETTVRVDFNMSGKNGSEGSADDAVLPQDLNSGTSAASPDTPRPALPPRIRVSSSVSQGLLVTKVAPDYPLDARARHIEGVVLMKVTIDKQGNLYRVEVISGHSVLASAAIEAVQQWKYRPYLLNGEPVEVETQVKVNFSLTP